MQLNFSWQLSGRLEPYCNMPVCEHVPQKWVGIDEPTFISLFHFLRVHID